MYSVYIYNVRSLFHYYCTTNWLGELWNDNLIELLNNQWEIRIIMLSLFYYLQMFLEQNKLKGYKCRCNGLSASCSLKTCYQGLINFNGLAAEIKCLYKRSCLISGTSTSSKIKLVSQCSRPISNTTLVHAVSSPDYCFKDISKGSLGVKGRSCHPDATDKSNCNTLCCNRGYKEIDYIITEQCCTFQWCCKTVCGACKKLAKKYECK